MYISRSLTCAEKLSVQLNFLERFTKQYIFNPMQNSIIPPTILPAIAQQSPYLCVGLYSTKSENDKKKIYMN